MEQSINNELLKQLNIIWDAIDMDYNIFYLKYLVKKQRGIVDKIIPAPTVTLQDNSDQEDVNGATV